MIKTSSIIFNLFGLIAFVSSQESSYLLPDGSEFVLNSPVQYTFSCANQPYGYYADVDNNCQIFHVCVPIQNELGDIINTAQYSFMCGNQTIFDQSTLTCSPLDTALPCFEAPTYFGTIEYGVIPPNFQTSK